MQKSFLGFFFKTGYFVALYTLLRKRRRLKVSLNFEIFCLWHHCGDGLCGLCILEEWDDDEN